TETTPENLRATISALGLPLLRGPLEPRERESFERLARAVVEEGGDFHDALRFVLEAMLQSPRFLYRMEGERRGVVGDYEIASRLSYIAWGAPPDDELLRAAAAGELRVPEKLAVHARRLLEHPRA